MVNFSDFSSVFEIAFALNAVVSYIQAVQKRGSREIASILNQTLREYEVEEGHALYSEKLILEARVRRKLRWLEFIASAMSFLTIASSISALGILIYAGFVPNASVSVSEMSAILICLLLLPLITLFTVFLTLSIFRQRLSQAVEKLAPKWEAAGFYKDGVIRLSVLAKQFRGISMREYDPSSFKSRIWLGLSRGWAKIRGHEIVSLEGVDVENLHTLSRDTGQDSGEVVASALALTKLIIDNPDSYTVITDKDGKEVKKVLNKDLIASIGEGKNPFGG